MQVGRSMRLAALGVGLTAFGCLESRDVEVSGRVIAPKSVSVGDALVIDFIDPLPEGSVDETPRKHRTTLGGLGEFKERVSLVSDQVELVGLDDRDGDGTCTEGEAWGRVSAPIEHDRADGITLMLLMQPCPLPNE